MARTGLPWQMVAKVFKPATVGNQRSLGLDDHQVSWTSLRCDLQHEPRVIVHSRGSTQESTISRR